MIYLPILNTNIFYHIIIKNKQIDKHKFLFIFSGIIHFFGCRYIHLYICKSVTTMILYRVCICQYVHFYVQKNKSGKPDFFYILSFVCAFREKLISVCIKVFVNFFFNYISVCSDFLQFIIFCLKLICKVFNNRCFVIIDL